MIKSFGIISILSTYIAIGILTLTLKKGSSYSISRYAADQRKTYLGMALFETVVLSMFTVFIVGWFVPYFQLSAVFAAIIAISAFGLLMAAWVPDTKGIQHKIHEYFAYGAFLLFIPATTIMIISSQISFVARFVAAVTLAYMIVTVLLFSLEEKIKQYHLYFQVVYMLLFHISILMAAYTTTLK